MGGTANTFDDRQDELGRKPEGVNPRVLYGILVSDVYLK
jgi:hypothetical protein